MTIMVVSVEPTRGGSPIPSKEIVLWYVRSGNSTYCSALFTRLGALFKRYDLRDKLCTSDGHCGVRVANSLPVSNATSRGTAGRTRVFITHREASPCSDSGGSLRQSGASCLKVHVECSPRD
jgi:hypothetical protein